MTRINVVPVEELCNKHLFAEWRELPRMAAFAHKAKQPAAIPPDYTLGEGHMKFFLDKGTWLERRHAELTAECLRRGYNLSNTNPFVMPDIFGRKDYVPTEQAIRINKERIAERLESMHEKFERRNKKKDDHKQIRVSLERVEQVQA
jgi:deoxyribonuclease (pyrimidine dimer)